MKILVCGGRDFNDRNYVLRCLEDFASEHSANYNPNDNWLPSDIEVISGGAPGVDTFAIDWAVVNWCNFKEYPADWQKHGKAAGPIRNKQMLEEGKPDIVLAFPGGKGTANMIRQAKAANITVIQY